jgi:hypothetical protein
MSKDFHLTIHGPRLAEWLEFFGSDTVQVRSPIPFKGISLGGPVRLFYQLDLDQFTADQIKRMTLHLAGKCGITEDEAQEELRTVGIPILAEDTSLTIANPGKWLD